MILRRRLKPLPPFNRTENHALNLEWYQELYWRQRYTTSVEEQPFPAFTIFDQGYILDAIIEPPPPKRPVTITRRSFGSRMLRAMGGTQHD